MKSLSFGAVEHRSLARSSSRLASRRLIHTGYRSQVHALCSNRRQRWLAVHSLVQKRGFYAEPTPAPTPLERLLAALMFFLPIMQHVQSIIVVAVANLQRGLLQAMVQIHHLGAESLDIKSVYRLSEVQATITEYYYNVADIRAALDAWQTQPLLQWHTSNELLQRVLPPLSGSLLRLLMCTFLVTLGAWLSSELRSLAARVKAWESSSSSSTESQAVQMQGGAGPAPKRAGNPGGPSQLALQECAAGADASSKVLSKQHDARSLRYHTGQRALAAPSAAQKVLLALAQAAGKARQNVLRYLARLSSRPELVMAAYSTAVMLTIVKAPLMPTPEPTIGWYAQIALWLAIASVAIMLYWSARCVAVQGPRVVDFARGMVKTGGQLCGLHMVLLLVDMVVTLVGQVEVPDKVQYCLAFVLAAALVSTFQTIAYEQLGKGGKTT